MSVNPPPGGSDPLAATDQKLWDRLNGRPCIAIRVDDVHTGVQVVQGPGLLVNWALHETASAAGGVDFYDGSSTGGTLLASASVPSGGSPQPPGGREAVLFRNGLFMDVQTSTVKGAVWVII